MKKKIIEYAGIVLAFLILSYGFVPQVLGGKIVNQSDISGYVGMSHEMSEWNAAHPDDLTAWTGSMFAGMPTAAIHSSTKGDWTQSLYDALLFGKRPATYLFVSLLGAFLLLLSLGANPWIAAGGAAAVTFCAYNLQIIQVGHNTKMQAIAFLPWVLAAVIFTYRGCRKKEHWLPRVLLGAAFFALALSFQIKANHPQISYYLAILILFYAVAEIICIIRNSGSLKRFFIASGLLLFMGVVGIATNATKVLPTMEYTPYSMRGGSSASADGSKASKGLDLDYATAWSYGWEELPNLLIPNFNGGSSAGAVNPSKSATVALLKKYGQGGAEVAKSLPLYWGPQPFTAGPMYMGAVSILLFLLGMLLLKGKERWWALAATILAVLLAVGNHFMPFTRLCFNVLPLYNKFRTVSMALVVLQFTLPVLGFLTLDRIFKGEVTKAEFFSKGWIALAIAGGFCLIAVLFPSVAGNFNGAADAGQPKEFVDALAADRRSLLVGDAFRSLLLTLGTWLIIAWGFAAEKVGGTSRKAVAAAFVCVLALADVFFVGKRYLNADDFVSPKNFNAQFKMRPVDKMILEDKDPSYRVLDLSVNVFNDSHPSYWHKNIGGYSPAKLQLYQEYIDSHLAPEINALYKALSGASTIDEAEAALPELEGLSKLNCRYIILGGEYPPLRYRYAKGNAWFEAGEGEITLSSYAPNALKYDCNSEKGGKVVFSEVYYPAGWVLTLDGGEELPLELSDEVLRSAVVPAGSHSLEMRFCPKSYARGETVSRCSSILILLLVVGSIAFAAVNRRRWKSDSEG